MQGQNIHPVALANAGWRVGVSAYEPREAHHHRSQWRNHVVSAREDYVRPCEGFGRVDDEFAIRCQSPQHGRGWCYFAGVVSVDTLIWLALVAFLIGCLVGFVTVYGEATWAYVRMYG